MGLPCAGGGGGWLAGGAEVTTFVKLVALLLSPAPQSCACELDSKPEGNGSGAGVSRTCQQVRCGGVFRYVVRDRGHRGDGPGRWVMRSALRQTALRRLWFLSLVGRMTRSGQRGDPGVGGASEVTTPKSCP